MSAITHPHPTIVVLSPTPWNFPVKQIQYFAQAISHHFPTTYINTNALPSRITATQVTSLFSTSRPPLVAIDPFLATFAALPQPVSKYLQTKALGKPPYVFWVFTSQIPSFVKTSQFPIVYDFIDRTYDIPNQKHECQLRNDERWLLKNAAKVVTATQHYHQLAKQLVPSSASKLASFPIGFNLEPFLNHNPPKHQRKRPHVLYLGGISPRLNFSLIKQIVHQNTDIRFTFIGPTYHDQDSGWLSPSTSISTPSFVSQLERLGNVTFMPALDDPDKLAHLAAQADIGWIPYDTAIPYNQHCTPVKFLEYLALGLPILSTPLQTITDFKPYYLPFSNAKQFQSAIQQTLANNSADLIQSRKSRAKTHSLPNKVKHAVELIDSLI